VNEGIGSAYGRTAAGAHYASDVAADLDTPHIDGEVAAGPAHGCTHQLRPFQHERSDLSAAATPHLALHLPRDALTGSIDNALNECR